MAEKLKRLMEEESLPTPTLSSEKRQEYTSTLHKVVGKSASASSATLPTTPTPGRGGGGAASAATSNAASGPLAEDPSLYQHPEDPGAFNLQYRWLAITFYVSSLKLSFVSKR